MTVFALDYDGTYTGDPELWLEFVKRAQERGHKVVCVTMRHAHETTDADFDQRLKALVEIVPTNRKAKKHFMRTNGKHIDIWIDDTPEWLFQDAG